jgi:hypothetical protein
MRSRPLLCIALFILMCAVAVAAAPSPEPSAKRAQIGPNVFLEVQGQKRRVIVPARVCLREGRLEGLVTRAAKGKSKDHEYVLAADIDARHLHKALLLSKAEPGAPVKYLPKFTPPSGTSIRISIRYQKDGKKVTVPAAEWFRHVKTKKLLAVAWVFTGSGFGPNPVKQGGPPYYMANHGAVISVCNVEASVLDLPQRSPKPPNDRLWEANTDKIPATGTQVELILEPLPGKKPVKKR